MVYISFIVFFFNDTATTEIYTLSLHDALPISPMYSISLSGTLEGTRTRWHASYRWQPEDTVTRVASFAADAAERSEEHTSELQSRQYLVCRLLLEKKKSDHIR